MAKIETKTVVIRFSKIVKDKENAEFDIDSSVTKTLEDVAQEMCGSNIVVEAEVLENE
jgi:hypothetical protein